jgi:hypothetical protein
VSTNRAHLAIRPGPLAEVMTYHLGPADFRLRTRVVLVVHPLSQHRQLSSQPRTHTSGHHAFHSSDVGRLSR